MALTRQFTDMVVDRKTGEKLSEVLGKFIATPPSTPSSAGQKGSWSADAWYLYVCFADNQWSRVALTTW